MIVHCDNASWNKKTFFWQNEVDFPWCYHSIGPIMNNNIQHLIIIIIFSFLKTIDEYCTAFISDAISMWSPSCKKSQTSFYWISAISASSRRFTTILTTVTGDSHLTTVTGDNSHSESLSRLFVVHQLSTLWAEYNSSMINFGV